MPSLKAKKIIREHVFELGTHASFLVSRRLGLLSLGIGLVALILFGKAFVLTVMQGRELTTRYDEIHSQFEWILAPRGLITDATDQPLALNAPGKKEHEFSRIYPQGEAFSCVLGFIGRIDQSQLAQNASYLPYDLIGKTGIEAQYEQFLRGKDGSIEHPLTLQQEAVSNAPGMLINSPTPGNNVRLTLDSAMQKKLFEIVTNQVKKFNAPGGAAILMDPHTGAIKSLVSVPTYDNNDITVQLLNDPARPLFNRAVSAAYPPGSSIKPFLAASALHEGVVTPSTIVHDRGKIEVPSSYDSRVVWTFHGWKALGDVDMRKAIAQSSNVYFFTVGGGVGDIKGLGIEKIRHYLSLFGFSQKSGIDLGSENAGFLPSPQWKKDTLGEQWFIGDTYNSSIGQGFVQVTPLQLAVATAALANNGTIYKPYLLDHITDQQGKTVFLQTPEAVRSNFLASSELQVAREGMRQAVTAGTMWRLRDLPMPVAGKTGTAQAGAGKPYHGWVTIFFPYDKPELVLTIFIENGEGGEQSAVPAAKEFLEWYIDNAKFKN